MQMAVFTKFQAVELRVVQNGLHHLAVGSTQLREVPWNKISPTKAQQSTIPFAPLTNHLRVILNDK